MGYDLHITRANDWTESEKHPISVDEWKKLIAEDPELRGQIPGVFVEDAPNAEWIGAGGKHENEEGPTLFWNEGRITVSGPDPAVIRKMTQIAAAFNAKTFGDDGEEYLPNGDVVAEKYTDSPPGAWIRFIAWLTRKPLPEREFARVVTSRWVEE